MDIPEDVEKGAYREKKHLVVSLMLNCDREADGDLDFSINTMDFDATAVNGPFNANM